MRIALVHSYYRSGMPSGENQVVDYQAQQLEERGHSVVIVAEHSDLQDWTVARKLRAGIQVAFRTGTDPTQVLNEINPDIVHVHNLFPNFGYKWLTKWKGALVTTLHNYRPVCANGLLFRDGQFCELCPTGVPFAGVRHGCYENSRVKSLPLALRNAGGLGRDPLLNRASAIILLSVSALKRYVGYGLDPAKCKVIPNGVDPVKDTGVRKREKRAIYVGRLTQEKGVRGLVASWPNTLPLDIVGEGPLRSELEKLGNRNVTFLGQRNHDQLIRDLSRYSMLVFPSECVEMQPTVVIEALAAGLPILARYGNSGADIVLANNVGRVYEYPTIEAEVIRILMEGETLRQSALSTFRSIYTVETWIDSLENLYSNVISEYQSN